MPPRPQIAALAPGQVLAEASGGTGIDASEAPQGAIVKGLGIPVETAGTSSDLTRRGLELAYPRFFNLHDNGDLGGIGAQEIFGNFGDVEHYTIWPDALVDNGALRMTARGVINTIAVPGTLTIRAQFTSPDQLTNVVVCASAANALFASLVNSPWELDLFLTWTVDTPPNDGVALVRSCGSFKIKNSLLDASPFNAWQLFNIGTNVNRKITQQPDFTIDFNTAGNFFNVQTMTGEWI